MRYARFLGAGLCALTFFGCNWTRFKSFKEDSKVERLSPSNGYDGGFGITLTSAVTDEQVELFVGGREYDRGGLTFSLGVSEDPQFNPTDEKHCPLEAGAETCGAVAQPAGLVQAYSSEGAHDLCFVSGVGESGGRTGLWTRCEDNAEFVYPLPSDLVQVLSAPQGDEQRNLRLSTNKTGDQALLAVTSWQNRAWFYLPGARDPLDLAAPDAAGEEFASQGAVLRVGEEFYFAVSEPGEAAVWLYRGVDAGEDSTGELVACLSGDSGFGRTLASGDVDGDGEDDLLIADEDKVTAVSGAGLTGLAADPAPACEAVEGDALLAQAVCEEDADTENCRSSDFGASLAVGDLDGDGKGEIVVGAPEMKSLGVTQAGAVLVFDQGGDRVETVLIADGEDDNFYGASLATPSQGDRDLLVVGASRGGFVYLHYCAGGATPENSDRCN